MACEKLQVMTTTSTYCSAMVCLFKSYFFLQSGLVFNLIRGILTTSDVQRKFRELGVVFLQLLFDLSE